MAAIASIGSDNSPVKNIPTPLLLAGIGGGLGLIVFLMRRNSGGSTSEGGTLLPNTSIMLGSLQQSLLELQGEVGSGNANLGDMITGVGSNLGAQIDAQTGQIQQGFLDLSGQLVDLNNANTQTILGAFKSQGDALSALIGSSFAAQQSYNTALSQQLSAGIGTVVAVQNAELAAIGKLKEEYGNDYNSLYGALQQVQGSIANIPGPWSQYEGKIIAQGNGSGGRADPTHTLTYYVHNGKLWGIGSGTAFQKLAGITPEQYAIPAYGDRFISFVGTPDSSLRLNLSGWVNDAGQTVTA
jgi:hypothetical protein